MYLKVYMKLIWSFIHPSESVFLVSKLLFLLRYLLPTLTPITYIERDLLIASINWRKTSFSVHLGTWLLVRHHKLAEQLQAYWVFWRNKHHSFKTCLTQCFDDVPSNMWLQNVPYNLHFLTEMGWMKCLKVSKIQHHKLHPDHKVEPLYNSLSTNWQTVRGNRL